MRGGVSEEELQRVIGYRFTDIVLLRTALTHASDVQAKWHNERLEFLGDRVLGLVVAEMLFADEGVYSVGEMARYLNYLVSRHVCAEVARALDLSAYARRARPGLGQRHDLSIHANLTEALIASLYLDGGLPAARDFIWAFWRDRLRGCADKASEDLALSVKNALQELAQSLEGVVPVYEEVSRSGPDHAPLFKVEVRVAGLGSAYGEGGSRREAEKRAARKLFDEIKGSV